MEQQSFKNMVAHLLKQRVVADNDLIEDAYQDDAHHMYVVKTIYQGYYILIFSNI